MCSISLRLPPIPALSHGLFGWFRVYASRQPRLFVAYIFFSDSVHRLQVFLELVHFFRLLSFFLFFSPPILKLVRSFVRQCLTAEGVRIFDALLSVRSLDFLSFSFSPLSPPFLLSSISPVRLCRQTFLKKITFFIVFLAFSRFIAPFTFLSRQ